MNVCITGGAGFIGSNATAFYLKKNAHVTIYDNLSRYGAKENISWLQSLRGDLTIIQGDIRSLRDITKIQSSIHDADFILHLAGQVAVTTSIEHPREDFEANTLGTLNVLEVMRKSGSHAKFIYSSTNKVYGSMEDMEIQELASRYMYKYIPFGVNEMRGLDFHSPYGCSKGAADQYVHDYSRIYGLDTVVFRQSCIYGPRQFGMEDQGWVAWFIIAIAKGAPISIYGDGKQVRDLLYVNDLIHAYDMAYEAKDKTRGGIYNIGGGPENVMSVWYEFGPMLEKLFGRKISPKFFDWRAGDQKVFVADIRKARDAFGWKPDIGVTEGIAKLFHWVMENKQLFAV